MVWVEKRYSIRVNGNIEPSLPGVVEVRLPGCDLVQFPHLPTRRLSSERVSDLLKVTPVVGARFFYYPNAI